MNFLLSFAPTMTKEAVVYSLLPIFKVRKARASFVQKGGVRDILAPVLIEQSGSPQVIYSTICCLWYISFDEDHIYLFEKLDLNLVPLIITELQKAEKEKILRVSLALLKNLCEFSERAVETMVERKLLREIDAIAKRVLKDEDVKQYLEDVSVIMENSIKLLSSFEKYMVEIENGKLVPGVTHTESFWKENVRNFEANRFEVVGKIAALLDSEDEES
jgi:V-type H+-transporting ATPase subunit H